MSDTALDHPLVRAYLRKLDEALASLPSERAAELRDQIAGHLEEELPPSATDDEVAGAIRRMGTPADLAREAGARRDVALGPQAALLEVLDECQRGPGSSRRGGRPAGDRRD